VSQQTREIGIRMALGALRGDVLRRVTSRAAALASMGAVLGLGGAAVLTRWMKALLFGVSPTDVATLTGAALLLICVAMLAAYVPARRASKVDPLVALRYE
jgi:putative ABC transport system permease protein